MIRLQAQAVLLDVEGTTSSISFVYDRMFPYARKTLHAYVHERWESPELQKAVELLAKDAQFSSAKEWFSKYDDQPPTSVVIQFSEQLMASDSKATGLKSLQGLLWKSGFDSGELQSHLFEDVKPALEAWTAAGLKLAIYSSGSVTAQRLFFGHTIYGDLNRLFSANFDTTTGPKRSATSYTLIAEALQIDAPKIVFLSDVSEELSAANSAGMQTIAVVRPGNSPLPSTYDGLAVSELSQLAIDR